MKVSGFSFIRNALRYDYPIVEAIQSILPICDEFVVAVGNSEDATLDLIQSIPSNKIRILETEWDDSLREGGRVLAKETDKAFRAIAKDSDWAFYIQGDEVIHEQYLPIIRRGMERCVSELSIDGLLFKYLHFYGSYDYVGASANWYPREIRVIRNDPSIYSYRDAQGFRKGENQKLTVHPIEAYVYHYGWVKDPRAMQQKHENFNKYWHDDAWVAEHVLPAEAFDYDQQINKLARFEGDHPAVMRERIASRNWTFDADLSIDNQSWKDRAKLFLRQKLLIYVGYRNYKIKKIKGA